MTPSPRTTSSEIVENGPIETPSPIFALAAIDARGEIPTGTGRNAKYFARTCANAKYGSATRMKRSSSPAVCSETRIAAAFVDASCGAYFGLERKASCVPPASASGATPSIIRSAGPS